MIILTQSSGKESAEPTLKLGYVLIDLCYKTRYTSDEVIAMLYQGPTKDYVDYICKLYDDVYDDRIENCKPPVAGEESREPGVDWLPGQIAAHKSLIVFQDELISIGIKLSSSKIRKILITGGCWSTERSREIGKLFNRYTSHKYRLTAEQASKRIADELNISLVTVNINLPYRNVVYNLENKSKNAVRCARYKERKKQRLNK